jgi:hypothetical protein
MVKSVNINTDNLKQQWQEFQKQVVQFYEQAKAWLIAFFKQIDTYEIIAVCAIGVGFLLVITGIILL